MLGNMACVTTQVGGFAPTTTSSATDGASFSIGGKGYHVETCRSGDREYFLGVDLADDAGGARIRLAIDPIDGPRLRVAQGAGESRQVRIFDRRTCDPFEVDLRPTGWRVNRVRDFSGSLDAVCASGALDVRIHVRFEHCH
jgi:hypothetical protein